MNFLKFKVYSFEVTQGKWSARAYFANLNEGVSMRVLTYFLCHGKPLGVDNGVQLLLLEFFDSVLVISQVQLGAHQDYGCVGAVVPHLRVPLWAKRTVSQKWQDTVVKHRRGNVVETVV